MVSIAANIALNLALIGPLKHVGIALASSLSGWINVVLMAAILHRRGHLALDQRLLSRAPRLLLAAVAMGAALFGLMAALDGALPGGLALQALVLALLVGGGALFYGGMVLALKAGSIAGLRASLRRQPGLAPTPPDAGDGGGR